MSSARPVSTSVRRPPARQTSRARTPRRIRSTPVRSDISSRLASSRWATSTPTVPNPSSPTFNCTPVFCRAVATLLREADVERVIKMEPIIEAVAAAMRELGDGVAENIPRRRIYPPGNVLNVMFASYPGPGYSVLKSYSIGGGKVRFLVALYRQDGEDAGNIDGLI